MRGASRAGEPPQVRRDATNAAGENEENQKKSGLVRGRRRQSKMMNRPECASALAALKWRADRLFVHQVGAA